MMCNEHFNGPRERILMKNIAYAGSIVAVLGIDVEMVEDLIAKKYVGKEKLLDSNKKALHLGYDFARTTLSRCRSNSSAWMPCPTTS